MYFAGVFLARGIKLQPALLNKRPISKIVVPISLLGTWHGEVLINTKVTLHGVTAPLWYNYTMYCLIRMVISALSFHIKQFAVCMGCCSRPWVMAMFFLYTQEDIYLTFQIKHRETHLREHTSFKNSTSNNSIVSTLTLLVIYHLFVAFKVV